MTFASDIRNQLETEERRTVGASFGGDQASAGSFSVPRLRDWILENYPAAAARGDDVARTLTSLSQIFPIGRGLRSIVASAIRTAFLVELTDLKVGSTRMKTRWLPGSILMPQPNSYEPVRGIFQPGNDPRASTFADCYAVFGRILSLTVERTIADQNAQLSLQTLQANTRVPYEYPVGYIDPSKSPLHFADNIAWQDNADLQWLVQSRPILRGYAGQHAEALSRIMSSKFDVKVYKTDRSLTGKDKTNRAKRWEVLYGDFQFATLSECWSVERKLTTDLTFFANFPVDLRQLLTEAGLVPEERRLTCCPITLAPLDFVPFAAATLQATHGRSDYQVGHLTPLKRGGRHSGPNVAWQSADGNRIQGDLTQEEATALLVGIAERRSTPSH